MCSWFNTIVVTKKHFFKLPRKFEASASELKGHFEEMVLRYFMPGDTKSMFKLLTAL